MRALKRYIIRAVWKLWQECGKSQRETITETVGSSDTFVTKLSLLGTDGYENGELPSWPEVKPQSPWDAKQGLTVGSCQLA